MHIYGYVFLCVCVVRSYNLMRIMPLRSEHTQLYRSGGWYPAVVLHSGIPTHPSTTITVITCMVCVCLCAYRVLIHIIYCVYCYTIFIRSHAAHAQTYSDSTSFKQSIAHAGHTHTHLRSRRTRVRILSQTNKYTLECVCLIRHAH